jgi:hypothetical protein
MSSRPSQSGVLPQQMRTMDTESKDSSLPHRLAVLTASKECIQDSTDDLETDEGSFKLRDLLSFLHLGIALLIVWIQIKMALLEISSTFLETILKATESSTDEDSDMIPESYIAQSMSDIFLCRN